MRKTNVFIAVTTAALAAAGMSVPATESKAKTDAYLIVDLAKVSEPVEETVTEAESLAEIGENELAIESSAEELLTKFKNEGRVVTTGYGRSNLPGYTDEVSEISCHAKGASHLCPSVRTIIDIGGQDCKVISVGPQGKVLDFQMNDKCSAGTGRFFEVISRVLDIDLTHLAEEALKSKKPCSISKQCSVFAESEVISLVNNSVPLPDIAAGIHESIARRIHGMAFKVGVEEDVALTGGCSSNKALRKALEKRLHLPLAELTMDPQLMGALGAALFAKEHFEEEKAQAS